MLACGKHYLHMASRLITGLVIALAVLFVSGCPLSNWSGPSVAPAHSASTPPPSAPPPIVPPPVATPPITLPPSTPPPATSAPTAPAPTVMPTAVDGTLTTTVGAAKAGMLAGTGTHALTYAIVVPTLSGTATLSNPSTGVFTYTPNPNFSGTDRLQFTVTDSVGTSKPATVSITVSPASLGALSAPANIGVNANGPCYYCMVQPYVDVIKTIDFTDTTSQHIALATLGKLDQDGWPEEDFEFTGLYGTLGADNSHDDPGTAPILTGAYQLSFNGTAVVHDWGYDTIANQSYDPTTNTTTATVNVATGGGATAMIMQFTQTQRTAASPVNTGLTNVKLIRPQFAPNGQKWWDSPTQEFTNPFLNSFKGFSTIRSMNWTGAINSPEVDWADRTPDNWPTVSHYMTPAAGSLKYLAPPGGGMYQTGQSWESAIDLANATQTDMWINIPVMATDDYVKSLAALIKSRLNPSLHVYVEWSDEIWNFGNPWWTETNFNADQLNAQLAADSTENANYAAHCDGWAYAVCHVAERVMQFSQDFASVYGQAAINTTIRPLLCYQGGYWVMVEQALRFIAEAYGPPSQYFYAICGAPYWNPANALPSGSTEADVLTAMNNATAATVPDLTIGTAMALYYGLHHFTYEGGPALGYISITNASSADLTAILTQANLDPGMGANVTQGLTTAFQTGVDMYMYYSGVENANAGYWGATPDILDLGAPKFAALTTLAGQPVTRNAGITLPADFPVTPYSFGVLSSGAIDQIGGGWNCTGVTSWGPAHCSYNGSGAIGSGLGYLVNSAQASTYSVSLVIDDLQENFPSTVELDIDQKAVGAFSVPDNPGGTPLTVGPITVTLTAGLHLVEIKNASTTPTQGFSIDSINFVRQ